MMREKPANGVLVLGMHRSGTSCLAGSLQEAGLYLGKVKTSSPFNKKGNRENKTAMRLHEDVLTANGGRWHKPPVTVQWTAGQLDRLDELIASYPGSGLWGIKDPRLLLVLDVWLERLSFPQRVASIRNPVAVVRSLQTRHPDFTEDAMFELYHAYNQLLIDQWKESPFPIVNFDCSATEYAAQIDAVAKGLGLPGLQSDGLEFFDDALRQNAVVEGAIPPHVAALYEELLEIAGS
jgi:hypothetical protein